MHAVQAHTTTDTREAADLQRAYWAAIEHAVIRLGVHIDFATDRKAAA